jgi:hypothetical protein
MRKLIASICMTICISFASAQKSSNYKFSKLTAEDLKTITYSIDSNANAVILADVGESQFVGNLKGWFSLVFKKRTRIHILNKNGYNQADIEIPLWMSGNAIEKLEELKATTYNLVNGAVTETKLEKSNVFTEKKSKNLTLKKFTLPNVKEGSIIDIEYVINSDFLHNLQPWSYQGGIPRLWSEYNVFMPEFFEYAFLSQGMQRYHINEKKENQSIYNIVDGNTTSASERFTLNAKVIHHKWVMKDIPALKEESFTSSIGNYTSKIDFQLSAFRHPLKYKNIMSNWMEVATQLLDDEDFGKHLSTNNGWLSDVVKPLLDGANTETEKAKRIFDYVRENFTSTGYGSIYISQPLKNCLKTKSGRVSDINMLLTAMLRYANIQAEPIILSTKSNGFTYPIYPLLNRFNYVVALAETDGKTIFLDASRSNLGFGKLLPECYNGHARIINKNVPAIEMYSDSLKEKKLTVILMGNDDKGTWAGTIKKSPGYYESYGIRNKIDGKGSEEFFKEMKRNFVLDIDIKNEKIDSLKKIDLPVQISYDFEVKINNENLIYFNPLFGEGMQDNPFKSLERLYPVEMPYAMDNTIIATIEVPKGYEIDELPKSVKVSFNDRKEGMFEYLTSHSQNIISLRTRLQMTRANFDPEEYEDLREFFNMIVSKQKEQIVFKKKTTQP